MAMKLDAVTRPVPKWVIDRIEEGWATLENTSTFEVISLPADRLPKGAKPGDTLVRQNTRWYIDHTDTDARARLVEERFAKLRAGSTKL